MITLWVARDRDNSLALFKSKPINHADISWIPIEKKNLGSYIELPEFEFQWVNYDNSPQEITLIKL